MPDKPEALPSRQTPEQLTLLVNGVELEGWKEVRVSRGVERFPSDFEIVVTDKYAHEILPRGQEVKFRDEQEIATPGQSCVIKLGTDTILTGYIDRLAVRLSATGHDIYLTGRSKCQDLIDCSAEIRGQQQRVNGSIITLAQELARPYGITVNDLTGGDVQNFGVLMCNLGESPYEILERVARSVGVLIFDDPTGNLVIARVVEGEERSVPGDPELVVMPGHTRDALVTGVNVQSAQINYTMDQRYQRYLVFPQAVETQNDQLAALDQPATPAGSASDSGVTRNRQLYLVGEQFEQGQSLAQQRAIWEKNRRYGRSQTVRVITDSWRDADGQLWEPNTLMVIALPQLLLSTKAWVVADVTYTRTLQGGTQAELSLMPRTAFAIQPTTLSPFDWDQSQAISETATPAPEAGAAP